MIKNTGVSFGLVGINTEQFATFDDVSLNDGQALITTSINFNGDYKQNILVVYLKFVFTSDDLPFIIIEVACQFKFEPESWNSFVVEGKNKVKIPKEVLLHLATITTGTSRGVLFCKLENTKLSPYFIPLVNLTDMIKEDIEFDFNEQS
jgi:hypothetical protein